MRTHYARVNHSGHIVPIERTGLDIGVPPMPSTRNTLTSLTNAQLIRLWDRLEARIYESGGCLYGWDWPTIRITLPSVANSLSRVRAELVHRMMVRS